MTILKLLFYFNQIQSDILTSQKRHLKVIYFMALFL